MSVTHPGTRPLCMDSCGKIGSFPCPVSHLEREYYIVVVHLTSLLSCNCQRPAGSHIAVRKTLWVDIYSQPSIHSVIMVVTFSNNSLASFQLMVRSLMSLGVNPFSSRFIFRTDSRNY